jgi:pyridoxal phosphate enzyme (YggS family)
MVSPDTIRRNLERIRARMAAAAARAGRRAEDVTLVAVTKSVGPDEVRALHDLGLRDFGENRVQELQRKQQALPGLDARWHLIGHLQTNKVRKVVGAVEMLHSLDSIRLAETVEREAAARQTVLTCLAEVNVSGEESKGGVPPDWLGPLLDAAAHMPHLRVLGLMTMAPLAPQPEAARPVFRRLRELRDRHAAAHVHLTRLSMGMTQDFETAIDEGADFVRIGTALFEEKP